MQCSLNDVNDTEGLSVCLCKRWTDCVQLFAMGTCLSPFIGTADLLKIKKKSHKVSFVFTNNPINREIE